MPQLAEKTIIQTQKLSQVIQIHDQRIHVLKSIDLKIVEKEQVAITGRSGSGKSTLLGLLAALDQPFDGEVHLCGHAIHSMTEEQRAKVRLENIGFVFQSFQLSPHLSALDNVLLPMRLQSAYRYNDAKEKAQNMLERVGLIRQMSQTPKVLSGGEQQRVAIARAIVNRPSVLIADEPTGNLDPDTSKGIVDLFKHINNFGTTVIMVTHNMDLVSYLNKRVIRLKDGRVQSDNMRGAEINEA